MQLIVDDAHRTMNDGHPRIIGSGELNYHGPVGKELLVSEI